MTKQPGDVASPLITVCTPTFNRASHLARVHDSLRAQMLRDFEWLVVDDGSTDGTQAEVERLATGADFPVRYVWKENGGKHTALNLGAAEARGSFCAVLDSDDWYLPHCLARLKHHWDTIQRPEEFAEVQGLCSDPNGVLLGDPYPEDVFDSDYYTNSEVLGLKGDRKGMIRTEVLRAFPFPEDFPSALVPEAIVWNRISRRLRVRGFNEVIAQNEYLATGLTRHESMRHVAQSAPRLLYLQELLELDRLRPLPRARRFKAYANLTRNSLHQRRDARAQARLAPSKSDWLLAWPLGFLLYLRDLWRER